MPTFDAFFNTNELITVMTGRGLLVVVHEQFLQIDRDLVLDRLQAPRALPDEHSRGRPRHQHALHDRLEAQVQLDL